MYALQRAILDAASKPLPLYVRDRDFFARCAAERGCVAAACHGDRLMAYAVLYVPQPGEENYGVELDLPQSELAHVSHLAGSGVHPLYRGNRLQSRLVDLRCSYAHAAGYYHMCGEVLPTNVISIRNHLERGYFLKGFKVDRFDLSVYLLHRDTRVSPKPLRGVDRPESSIDDAATYRRLLAEGYWGFRVARRAEGWRVVYGRFE